MLRVKRRRPPEIQWPLTALIDIVFLLLIYFLLTTNFLAEEGISVHLPKAQKASPQQEEPLNIYVNKAGNFFLGRQPVTPARLLQDLREALRRHPDRVVVVKADREVILDKAVRAMDIARAAGAKKLFLATEQP